MNMQISIIIPTYNSANYLSRCIESCLNQTYEDIEILIINDGSTDDTISVVSNYLKYNHLNLINQENQGLVCARRTGIKHAKGDFIFFLDADDYIESDTLMLLALHANEGDIIIGDILLENEKGVPNAIQFANSLTYGRSRDDMYANYLTKETVPSLCGRLIKRSLLQNIQTPKKTTIGEDVITNMLILNQFPNIRTLLVSTPLYHYIQYPNSMINSKNKVTLLKRLEYIYWIIDFMKNQDVNKSQHKKALSFFVLTEYYSFLRDGGTPSDDILFFNRVVNEYWDKDVLCKISFWQTLMLRSFKLNPYIGKLYRSIFLKLRFIFK